MHLTLEDLLGTLIKEVYPAFQKQRMDVRFGQQEQLVPLVHQQSHQLVATQEMVLEQQVRQPLQP